jgi:hypothetical protein
MPKPCLSTSSVPKTVSIKLLFFHTSQSKESICKFWNVSRQNWQTVVWFPGGVTDFSLLQVIQAGSEADQPLIRFVLGTLSLGMKWLGHKVDHSNPPSVKVKNEWSYTSTPPMLVACSGATSLHFICCKTNLNMDKCMLHHENLPSHKARSVTWFSRAGRGKDKQKMGGGDISPGPSTPTTWFHLMTFSHSHHLKILNTVELGYNVMKGTEYFVPSETRDWRKVRRKDRNDGKTREKT